MRSNGERRLSMIWLRRRAIAILPAFVSRILGFLDFVLAREFFFVPFVVRFQELPPEVGVTIEICLCKEFNHGSSDDSRRRR